MSPKRTREIKIRLSPTEYETLMALKTEPRLASWIRGKVLSQEKNTKEKTTINVAPELLYELNKIGVNLNQIAKAVNKLPKTKWTTNHSIQLLAKLASIEIELKKALENAR